MDKNSTIDLSIKLEDGLKMKAPTNPFLLGCIGVAVVIAALALFVGVAAPEGLLAPLNQ